MKKKKKNSKLCKIEPEKIPSIKIFGKEFKKS